MKYFRLKVFTLTCICIASINTFAKEQLVEIVNDTNLITLTYDFDAPEIKTENGVTTVTVDGLDGVNNAGEPILPILSSQIVLPQGASVESFNVSGKAIDVDGSFVVKHAEFAQPLSNFNKNLVTEQNAEIYNLKSAYPAQLGYAKSVGKKFGYSILPFNLNPVSYIPADGKISYYKELTVSIVLSYDKNAVAGALAAEPTEAQLNDLYAIADDISSVKTYTVASEKSKNLTLPGFLFDYVVIIPEDFDEIAVNNLMTYHRDYNGYSITNVTVEWIESNYTGTRPSGGTDTQTKIREFIADAYSQWGTRFVMLVGGESIIPSRKLYAQAYLGGPTDEIPADMYFGCLNGTFDYNANGVYGESDDGVDGDDVDLFAEVYVGRAAVSTSEEFGYLVNKIIAYETNGYDEYLRAVHMLGEYLGFGGVSDYAKGMMEQIRLGGTYDQYTTKGFADSDYANQYDLDVNLYDEDADWENTELLTLMNEGSHIFNHLGHANPTYSMKLPNDDLDSLTNDKYFFVYSQGCMAGWFDSLTTECFAQKITRLETGAFGVIMNARYGWGSGYSTDGPSQRFARWFWDYVLGDYDKILNGGKLLEPGVANQLSKEKLASQIKSDCMRWITYELNLFGDPAAPFRFYEVTSSFTMDQSAVNSTNLVEIGVNDPNIMVSNLTVTVESYTNFVSLTDRGTLLATTDLDIEFDVLSGSFTTNIILADVLTPAPTDGNTIVYTYYDSENPSSPVTLYYVMTVDNIPPEISNIFVDDIAVDYAQVNFNTDEPVTGSLLYGTNAPPALISDVPLNTIVDPDTGLVDNHVSLSSLYMETIYCFAIVVSDEAGNTTSVPVDVLSTDPDDYKKFVTAGVQWSSFYNFVEDGPLNWTHGGLNDSWAFGEVLGCSNLVWSLDGWQTGLNAPYTLPCNTWLSSPFITSTDISYVDVTYELELSSGAIVYLEGYNEDGWQTLCEVPETEVSTARFDVQALDTSKPFKLRFRLLSLSGTAGIVTSGISSARGLSLFSVNLVKEVSGGIFIKDYIVDDSTTVSGNNNNNGRLDAGETVNLSISSINLSQSLIPDVRGTIDLPSPGLSITNGNTIEYGDMDVGEVVTASGSITVTAAADYNPELETSYLLQTALSVGTTNSWVDKISLYVEGNVAEISGQIMDGLGGSVSGAVVNIISESGIGETVLSLADGTFTGMRKYNIGDEFTISANADNFLQTTVTGIVSSNNYVEVALGRGYLSLTGSAPIAGSEENESLVAGEEIYVNLTVNPDGYATSEFEVSNIGGDSDISFDLSDVETDQMVISFEAGASTLTVGETTTVSVEAFAKTGSTYTNQLIACIVEGFEVTYLLQTPIGSLLPQYKEAVVWLDVNFETYGISGTVKDKQGNDLANIDLITDLYSLYTVTDASGFYEFSDLAPDTYQFWVGDINEEFLVQELSSTIIDSDVTKDITLERAYAQIQNAQPITLNLAPGQSENVILDISNTHSSYTADSLMKYTLKNPSFDDTSVDVSFDKTSGSIEPLDADQILMTVTMPSDGTNCNFTVDIVHTGTEQVMDILDVEVVLVELDASFLKFVGYEVEDENKNSIVEAGENFEIFASLQNISPAGVNATNVVGSMSVVSGPAAMMTNVVYTTNCVAGATMIPLTNSVFAVDSGAAVGDIITLQFDYTWTDAVAGAQAASAMIYVSVGQANEIYFDPNYTNIVMYEGDTLPLSALLVNDSSEQKDFDLKVTFEQGKIIDEDTDFIPVKFNWNALDQKKIVANTLLIRPKDGQSIISLKLKLIKDGYKIKSEFSVVPGLLVEIPGGDSLATSAQTLELWPEVLYVEPEYIRGIYRQVSSPYRKQSDDPDAYYLWGLYNDGDNGFGVGFGTPYEDINAREAWYTTTGSEDVKVCIMDSGIYRSHEDLKYNLWINEGEQGLDTNGLDKATNGIDDDNNGAVDDVNGATFLTDIPNGQFGDADDGGHGTHVSGTVGAEGNNAIGVVGVNWDVSLVGAQVIGDEGGESADIWTAIEYCMANKIEVVNMSFGGSGYSGYEYELLKAAGESNILFVCAAGNGGLDGIGDDNDVPDTSYPCSYDLDNIISVAANDNNGFLAEFSNYGEISVDISAPGVYIYSTVPGMLAEGGYGWKNGTSMAAPHVTGVAALLKSIAPEASYKLIKQAILDSAVKSYKLEGKVATSGYLNAYDAVNLMQTYWVELSTNEVSVAATDSASVDYTINPNKNISYGEQYKANIVATDRETEEDATFAITIDVIPSIALEIDDVDVSDGDGDAVIEPGETVSLTPYMLNNGSMLLQDGITVDSIDFSDTNVTYTGSLTWGTYIEAGESQASSTPISVTFPSVVGSSVTMSITVTYNEIGRGIQTRVIDYVLPVDSVDVYTVSGSVINSVLGITIENATIEYFGQNTGFVESDENGNFEITGVARGDLTLKVYKDGYAVSEQITVYVGGVAPIGTAVATSSGDVFGVTFDLVKPTATTVVASQNIRILKGDQTNVTVTVQNTSNYDWETPVSIFRTPKIALISDGTQLEDLKTLVEQLGYDCDVLSDNIYNAYTLDSGILSQYDVLVLNLTGSDGSGRLLTITEADILENYKLNRGSLIITGSNPFNSPDNYYMSALLNNFVNNGLQEAVMSVGKSYSTTRPVDSVFGSIAAGSKVVVAEKNYDNILVNSSTASIADHNSAVDNLVVVDGATKVAYFDGGSNLGFGNFVWTGNQSGAEWTTPSILQDVFKNILLELAELRVEDEAVISGGTGTLNLPAGSSTNITLTFSTKDLYDNFSTNTYTLLFANGLEIDNFSKVLDFEISAEPFRFTAEALGGVTNWLGAALEGDGSDSSSIYQLIYAGPDGVISEPEVDGGTSGDDEIILRTFDGTSFGYFGYGVFAYPDKGRFADEFATSDLSSGDKVYVRAWDGSSIAAAVAYGDSPLYTVNRDIDEQHDFDAWAVGSVISYPGTYGMNPEDLADKNIDSIVDGFAVKYGFEATNPIEALETGWSDNAIVTYDGLGTPTRVAVGTNGYVYVTVSAADVHHIAIYDEDLSLIKTYSNLADPFDNPEGIAIDEDNSRLIVADTDKNRVVVLDVQDGTNITWNMEFGSEGDDDNQFTSPYDVAVGVGGKIYVADSRFEGASDVSHNRISVFTENTNFVTNIGTLDAGTGVNTFDKPLGVTFDDSGNMYVADFANERIRCLSPNGSFNYWTLDLPEESSKWINGAQDLSVVSYWYNGIVVKKRMFIADYNNSRILVYSIPQVGTPVLETSLGMYGTQPGDFKKPQGIFVSDGYVYIADTDNGRVQKLEVILDIDGDGMEDTWEDVHGLDSSVNDALEDPDGDGLYNIGEFRIETDPMNADTDGDGVSDGQETILGSSPWVVDSLAITAIIGGNGSLSFPALAGGTYRLEYVAGLMLPRVWQDGGTYTALTDGILTVDNLPGWGTTMMFYRVIWTNPDFN